MNKNKGIEWKKAETNEWNKKHVSYHVSWPLYLNTYRILSKCIVPPLIVHPYAAGG